MLEEFKDFLVNAMLPKISFILKGRVTHISLKNTSEKHYTHFLGELAGFEDVYFGISPLVDSPEEYRAYMGYIEIMNGNSEDLEPVPSIRGFIKKDIAFFESLSKMAIESKNSMVLTIDFDPSAIRNLRNTPTENILNMKLPIKTIEISQRVSFV